MAKVSDDAPTSLSLGKVMGEYPDGSVRQDYAVFAPGDHVPDEYLASVSKSLEDKDSHLHQFLEEESTPKKVEPKKAAAPKAKAEEKPADNPFTAVEKQK